MTPKILYIMSSYNIYGGTPKKTLDLMKYFGEDSVLYVYKPKHINQKIKFESTNGKIYEGFFNQNLYKHLKNLILIIDKENINIVQTQFTFGEILGYFIKIFRPEIKVITAFVGAIEKTALKSLFANFYLKKMDGFIYISNYVKQFHEKKYPFLIQKEGTVIYNGTLKREDDKTKIPRLSNPCLLSVSSLIKLKNIQTTIEAMNIIVNNYKFANINYYIVGKGGANYQPVLKELINKYNLVNNVHLLGELSNIGKLLNDADIFLHPSYNEGFGIAVAEAMHAAKPIIVSDAGAIPELIENKKSGIVLPPYDGELWAKSIIELINDKDFAMFLGRNAKTRANKIFSYQKFVSSYKFFYLDILNN